MEGEEGAPVEAAPQGRIRRLFAWMFAGPIRTLLVLTGMAASLGGFLVLWLFLTMPPAPQPVRVPPARALELFDEGEYAEARQVAESHYSEAPATPAEAGIPAYVLGLLANRDALRSKGAGRRILHLLAAQYFDESRSRGFPEGREAEGMLLLGKSLHGGGQYAPSRPILRDAAMMQEEWEPEIRYLLAEGYLRDPKMSYPDALREIDRYLKTPSLDAKEQTNGRILRSEILLQMGKPDEAMKTLGEVPSDSPQRDDIAVMRGWIVIQEARLLKEQPARAQTKYREAIRLLQGVQDELQSPSAQRATYLIGVCLLETGDQRGAMNQFSRTRMLYPGTPETMAADFQEGDIWRQSGRDAEALAAYRRALRAITDPESYNNPWFPLETMRRRTIEAFQYYLDAKNYKACLTLARSVVPLFARDRMLLMNAETYRSWGADLLSQAEKAPMRRAHLLQRDGRSHLRKAAGTFERLAVLRMSTRFYIDDLWESANAFLQGHDYRNAARMLGEYLKNEPRLRQAQALVALGECQLTLDQIDAAIATLERSLTLHPRDVTAYQCRIAASRAYMEKGDYARAEKMLNDNLQGEALTPASREWRQSLFLLGRVLYQNKRYPEAIRRLEEAVRRYGEARESLEARYLISDAYRQIAKIESEKLRGDLVEEARIDRTKRVNTSLKASLEQCRAAQEAILKFQESNELEASEKAMLRNCYFAVGNILFEMGQYDEAVKAFTLIANRYQNAPEVLDAYLQISRIHRLQNRPDEARKVIEQAKLVLTRMKPQTPFTDTTNYDATEWAKVLKQMETM